MIYLLSSHFIRQKGEILGVLSFSFHLSFMGTLAFIFFWKTSTMHDVGDAIKLSLLQVRDVSQNFLEKYIENKLIQLQLEVYQNYIIHSKLVFTGKKMFSLTWRTMLTVRVKASINKTGGLQDYFSL